MLESPPLAVDWPLFSFRTLREAAVPQVVKPRFTSFKRMAWQRRLIAFFVLMLCAQAGAQDSPRPPDTPLILGQSIQKQIKVNERHGYSFKLEKDYFAQVVVESNGVDVALTLFRPDGKEIERSQDYEGDVGLEKITLIVDEPQLLRLEVSAIRKLSGDGSYTIRLKALRLPQNGDRDLVTAEKLWREARLLGRDSEDSRREAIAKLKPAAQLFLSLGDLERAADTFHSLAKIYKGEHNTAVQYFEQALSLYRRSGNRRREALLLTGIGIAHSQSGEFEKALDYHTRALQLRRMLGLRDLEAASLDQIGIVYFRLGDPQRALTYHLQSLPVTRSARTTRDLAALFGIIGADYYAMEQYAQALDYFTQALALAREKSIPFRIIVTLRYVGFSHLKLGQTEKALAALNEALSHEQKSINHYERGNIFAGLGEAYYKLNLPIKARDYLKQAFPLLRNAEDKPGEAAAHYWLARVEMDQDNLDEALAEIEKTAGIVEKMRSNLASPELRTLYFASVERYYESYLEILWRLHQKQPGGGFDERALRVSEQCRARSLLELLNEGQIDIRQGVPAELLARERELQRQLNAKASAQLPLLSEEVATEQRPTAANEIAGITNALLDVRAQIHQQSPHYAALTQPQALSLKEIQETLDKDSLLLEYKLGEQRSFLWAITRSGFRAFELPGRAEIEPLARRVYRLLTARNRPAPNEKDAQGQAQIIRSENEYREAAEKLSQLLLGPVAPMLKSERLLIVSDGALQYIPFAALPDPESRQAVEGANYKAHPLILNHEIVTLPSASVIAVLRRETAARKPAPKAVAVFADPVFAKDDIRVAAAKRRDTAGPKKTLRGFDAKWFAQIPAGDDEKKEKQGPAITRLPFSRREANAILTFAPANETYVALDFEANRANATSPALVGYRIVHFATHGWLDSYRPELSGVVLSLVNQKGQAQDGVLRLHEIYNLQLNADLVVLSACQTALGKEVRGEGLVGLTRGFMYAGAPRVAASLWKVDDAATAELMTQFYRFMLKEQLSPAAALRAAQLELIKQKRWNAPYFWAGFILQGEWR
jgi:CHAT domain-containing protein/tetratricopeptide (TPR) repeat protein